jgi:AcrR family transcriptional regulator
VQKEDQGRLIERCLGAFVGAGTLDLSLDQLAASVGVSKRMLIHYFGGREGIEERAMTLLEDKLQGGRGGCAADISGSSAGLSGDGGSRAWVAGFDGSVERPKD